MLLFWDNLQIPFHLKFDFIQELSQLLTFSSGSIKSWNSISGFWYLLVKFFFICKAPPKYYKLSIRYYIIKILSSYQHNIWSYCKFRYALRKKYGIIWELRDSASSFHRLSSSIFSYWSFVCLSRIGDISSHLHYMMFPGIQTIYFLWGYHPGNMSVSISSVAELSPVYCCPVFPNVGPPPPLLETPYPKKI